MIWCRPTRSRFIPLALVVTQRQWQIIGQLSVFKGGNVDKIYIKKLRDTQVIDIKENSILAC